ncbi:putative phage protein (predicted DNA packaging) [Ewingella americana]
MIEFVTLEEVKGHLRIDTDAGDEDLHQKILSASSAVFDYVQGSRDKLVDQEGKIIDGSSELQRVKMAVLILVGILDRVRDGQEEKNYSAGNLPFSVTALIYSLRSPTVV